MSNQRSDVVKVRGARVSERGDRIVAAPLRRILSGLVAGAIVLTGGAFVASPAVANGEQAVAVTVTGNDIRSNESTYVGWHEGYKNVKRAYFVKNDGLHLGVGGVRSQVLNGTAPVSATTAQLEAHITSAEVVTTSGLATFQVPVFFGPNATQGYTTLRPADVTTGSNTFATGDAWVSSGDIPGDPGVAKNVPTPLSDILGAVGEQGSIRLLGFGVQAEREAVVTSITYDGTTYSFSPYVASGPNHAVVVRDVDVKPNETPQTYTEWHEGKSADASTVKTNGLQLGMPTASTVIKGTKVYTDPASQKVTQAQLQKLISDASVVVANGSVTFQVPVHFGADNKFTTVRSTGLAAGTHTFSLTDTWASTRAFGPYAAHGEGTLGDILDALYTAGAGDVWLAGYGVQADSKATVPSLVWNGTQYTFTQPVTAACTPTQGPRATNQNSNGWIFGLTGSTSKVTFVDGGVLLKTNGWSKTDKASLQHAVDIALKDVGTPTMHLSNETGVKPGIQLEVDFDNDGTADAWLIGETVYSLPDGTMRYWLSGLQAGKEFVRTAAPHVGGGQGSDWYGTLDEWLVPFPDAQVSEVDVAIGRYALGTATLHSFDFGCEKFSFGLDASYPASTATVQVSDVQIAPAENATTYTQWHEGYANAQRAYSTQADGLHLGDGVHSQIMKGVDAPVATTTLESLITSAAISVKAGKVTYQIPITYGTANTFTTLRSGSLAQGDDHRFSVSDNWVSTKPLKRNDGTIHTPTWATPVADLVTFLNEQGNVKVLGFGVQADSPAVVQNLIFGGTTYEFVPAAVTPATEIVRVTEPEIALTETAESYTQWHEGYSNATKSFSVAENGLHLGSPLHSQVMKGLEQPVAVSDLFALLTSQADASVKSGTVTFQVPVMFDPTAYPAGFTTLRSASLGSGDQGFALSDQWMSSKAFGGLQANTAYALADILDALSMRSDAKAIGFGVQADSAAVVDSIVWGNTTYVFSGEMVAGTATITGAAKVGETLTANAGDWDPASSTYSHQWLRDGVAISGATGQTYVPVVADVGAELSVSVTGSKVGYTAVTTTSAKTDEVPPTAPSVPAAPTAALEGRSDVKVTWAAPANGGSAITGYTVTLTPTTGTSAPVVSSVGAGETSHVFTGLTAALSFTATVAATNIAGTSANSAASTPPVRTHIQFCEAVTDGGVSTNGLGAANGWSFSGTLAKGHNEYVDGGLHVFTDAPADSKSKAVAYKTVTPIPLAQVGEPSIEFASFTGARPSIQLRVSTTGSAYGGSYVVGEPWAYGQYKWWSNGSFGVSPGLGYKSYGTLTDYLAAHPNAVVNQIGYSLGSGVSGDATITSMTFGCVKYTFDVAPTVQADTPTISGNAVFGSVLTANPGDGWMPTDASFTYQWQRDGVSLGSSARSKTYAPVAADIGTLLTVTMSGTKTGFVGASATSEPTTAVVAATMAGQASITGDTVVGSTLTAVPGAWTPANATVGYEWFRNGVAISDAIAKSYVLVPADMRATITVAITGSATGYSPATFTSAATAAVTVGAVVQQCTTVGAGPLSTNLDNNGWDFTQTRATGHNDYVAGGLHVWTEGGTSTDKAAGYRVLDIPLADVGQVVVDLSDGVDGLPSVQLGVDRDGNGTWDGYLVNEGDIYGAGMWWVNKPSFGVPSGGGYDSLGTLDEYIAANPAAKIMSLGYSLGSGLKGSAVIHSITLGCTEYTFDGRIVGFTPTISGSPTVYQTLTADWNESDWEPTGLTFAHQWLRDGELITGATGSTYTLGAADVDAKISVSVTGSKAGYTEVTKHSDETDAVARAVFVTVKPVVGGIVQVGRILSATDPVWTPKADALSYQWFVGGVAVSGATSKVYTVAVADLGEKVTFAVTGMKTGYATATATSLEAGPVTAGVLQSATPTLKPTQITVGDKITAEPGVWAPAPVTLTYQWHRDGVPVIGATGLTYTLAAADVGARMTVTVTGAKAGYVSTQKTSAPTAKVTGLPPVKPPFQPQDVYTTPGYHSVSGRQWFTKCEPYSTTSRCWTYIWSTQVKHLGGNKYVSKTEWFFNNLTYLPAERALWAGNPLGHSNKWTAAKGRKWYTECNTPKTGSNGCRSYILVNNVVEHRPKSGGGYTYVLVNKWIFNNIVLIK